MANLNELGKVIETDVLVIGAGVAGLSAAISAKEAHPELDVSIVDRRIVGKTGQAAKSGHGFFYMPYDPEPFVEDRVIRSGEYMNDQDILRKSSNAINSTVDRAAAWGMEMEYNEDGTPHHYKVPVGPWGGVALPLGINETFRKKAAAIGVRIWNRIEIADFVKDGDKISAALGVHVVDMSYYIFRAKSFVLCTQACNFGVQQMFNGMGEGIAMTYRAGAEMRNAEFGLAIDLCAKNDGHPVYGSHQLVRNKYGEDISAKYAPGAYECSLDLILGMEKEMEEGRGPLYVDLTEASDMMKSIGFAGGPDDKPGYVDGKRRLWPDAMQWQAHISMKAEKYRVITDEDPLKPLITAKLEPECSPVRVDINYKTSLPNLWAAGLVCYQGSAHIGWCRGDGVSACMRGGLFAGPGAADFAADTELAPVDPAQVEKLKADYFAPMQRKGGVSPNEIMDKLSDVVGNPKYMLHRTEASMTEALEILKDLKAQAANMYAEDGHMLFRCRQMDAIILISEMVFTAGLMRKESRGQGWRHHRDDYPTNDNKNWLKWIILKQGDDGEMKIWTEDIPIEKYKYKPADI